ncbi:hypothetical protein KY289_001197 [Solanum tuberosum]|nr:hypothetical protein KY289_001197 [Solanum tuberosum]
MIQIREEVEHNIWWQIRNGEESFWFDNLTKQGALYYLEEQNHSDEEIEVKEFIKEGGWDEVKLNQYVSEEMLQYIIDNINPILVETGKDKAWWMGNTSGSFTVNSFWELLRHRRGEMEILKFIWNKQIPFKINFFLWRVCKRRVPTDDNLQRMRINLVSRCWCCEQYHQETMEHLFLTAPVAIKLWKHFADFVGIVVEGKHLHHVMKSW